MKLSSTACLLILFCAVGVVGCGEPSDSSAEPKQSATDALGGSSADASEAQHETGTTDEGNASVAALNFQMKTLAEEPADLGKYKGNVVLMVNVASECGLTPQYEQLQALHAKYADQGLSVLGFPCNQFGGQEPGSADEIQQFCKKNYGVQFDLFAKVDVNGDNACDLYKFLTKLETKPQGPGNIGWNFEKFLVDRNGEVSRFSPQTKPNDPDLVTAIESALGAK